MTRRGPVAPRPSVRGPRGGEFALARPSLGGHHSRRSFGGGDVSLSMTREERETFLAGVHVGVVSITEPGRGPLTAPVWYAYEDGEVVFVIEKASRKAGLLNDGTRIS